jgi:hypothetical protein
MLMFTCLFLQERILSVLHVPTYAGAVYAQEGGGGGRLVTRWAPAGPIEYAESVCHFN